MNAGSVPEPRGPIELAWIEYERERLANSTREQIESHRSAFFCGALAALETRELLK